MLRLAFDFIITWRETRTRPNAYSEASDVTHKIKVNTSRTGAKALLRVAVEELTKQFSASLVNLFFADKDGGDLKIASHHRATAYDDYRREIARILS